ncbi:MAG TPA: hypothetical protein VEX67_13825 [Solirubrobacteraceae bacterium]|nr:hypothetical protein [Solirubrobacteraceae bacterium]
MADGGVAEHAQQTESVAEPATGIDGPTAAPLGAPTVRRAFGSLSPAAVLRLQRAAGNAAVVTLTEAAAKLRSERESRPGSPTAPGVRFRVPAPDELKRLYSGGVIPQSVVEDSVRRALKRMDADFDLRTGADHVMSKLFPGGGKFDETAWAGVLGTDTGDVYKSVLDAETQLKPADRTKLEDAARRAGDEIDKAMADATGLKEVFGTQAALAKTRYGQAKAALKAAIANSDKAIDTDYNRDDTQTGLGGWARHDIQHIHLTGDVAEVKDLNQSIITLIHEAAHLAAPDVDDLGYYKSPGFEAMSDAKKVCNAAHYEELPARSLGVSAFVGKTFTPGVKASGGKVTFEDEVRRVASEYLRKAWDAAVDAHQFVRETAKEIINNPAAKPFDKHKTGLLEVSKMEHLTIHQQVPAPSTVTTLDAVLSEGVAHGTRRIQGKLKNQTVPATKNKKKAADALIDGAINDYGELLGSGASEDRKLMDWLVKHYRKGF